MQKEQNVIFTEFMKRITEEGVKLAAGFKEKENDSDDQKPSEM